jgi:hypothetical protein
LLTLEELTRQCKNAGVSVMISVPPLVSCPNLNRKVFWEHLPKLRYFYLYLTELTFVQFYIEFQPTVLYVARQLVGFLAVFPGLNMEIFRRTRVLFCGGASMSKGPTLMLLERFKGYPLELREGKIF